VLSGENRAAIEVAKRDGEYSGACKYEIYGLDEETIWDELQTLEKWWKESTWARFIQRELPDL
jgi:TBC1 domain family member 14